MTAAPVLAVSPTAAKVRRYVAEHEPVTVRRVAADLGLSFPTVLGALLTLCDLGLVCHEVPMLADTPQWRTT